MKTTSKLTSLAIVACLSIGASVLIAKEPAASVDADAALAKLKEGNLRFATSEVSQGKPGDALSAAITENARLVADQIKAKAALGDLAKEVGIVFAVYNLDTGKIEWAKE